MLSSGNKMFMLTRSFHLLKLLFLQEFSFRFCDKGFHLMLMRNMKSWILENGFLTSWWVELGLLIEFQTKDKHKSTIFENSLVESPEKRSKLLSKTSRKANFKSIVPGLIDCNAQLSIFSLSDWMLDSSLPLENQNEKKFKREKRKKEKFRIYRNFHQESPS